MIQHDEYNILKIYCKLNIYAAITIGTIEIVNYVSMGEVKGLNLQLGRFELFLLLIIQIVMLGLSYPAFLKTKDRTLKIHRGSSYRLEINYKAMHRFMLLLLLANILFTASTGNATLGREVTSKVSFIFNIIQVRPLFLIYYVCVRQTKKTVYWINIVLYMVFRFMCGWSGHILTIVFLEAFLRIKYHKIQVNLRWLLKMNGILVVSAFFVGSWMYCFVYPFKNSIRYGYSIGSIPPLSFSAGVEALLSRFTNYPVTVAAVQNHNLIASLYQEQGKLLWEVESIFSPLLPRFIMPNKEFRGLNNIVKWTVFPGMDRTTGSGYNVLVYWANIFECSMGCFLVAIITLIVLFMISKKIIYLFDNGSKDVEILYFMLLYTVFSGSNLSSIFGYGYIPLLYTIPIMVILGIVKVKRRQGGRENFL